MKEVEFMYCSQCGKKLPDGVTVCECRSQAPQPPVASVVAPEGESAPVAQPAPVAPETPVVNSAPVVGAVPVAVPDVDCDREFLEVIKSCKLINILGIVLFVTGLVSLIFINGWVAAVVFLVGELFVLMPNTKVQKLCKAKNPTADKKSLQKITKETVKGLKSKDKNFKFSFIIAMVCLACLVLSFVVPAPLVDAVSRSINETTGSVNPITEQKDSVKDNSLKKNVYRPTLDEFIKDYDATHKKMVGANLVYYTTEKDDSTVMHITYNGLEYMTVECVTTNGEVIQVKAEVSVSGLCLGMAKGPNDESILSGARVEAMIPSFVILSYQEPSKYDEFEELIKFAQEVDDPALQNYRETNNYYNTPSFGTCVIIYTVDSDLGVFSCSCSIFEK